MSDVIEDILWITTIRNSDGRRAFDYPSKRRVSYTRTDKAEAELSAAHHDISRLQELNTKLLNGGELKDALEDLREANRLLELAENSLFIGLKIRNDVHPSNYEPLERAIMQIQAYRNKGQKP